MQEIIVYRNPAEAALWNMMGGETGTYFFVIIAGAIAGAIVGLIVMMFHRWLEKRVFKMRRFYAVDRGNQNIWQRFLWALWRWDYTSVTVGALVWVGVTYWLLKNGGMI